MKYVSIRNWPVLREDLDSIEPEFPRFDQNVVHAAGDGEVGAEHVASLPWHGPPAHGAGIPARKFVQSQGR